MRRILAAIIALVLASSAVWAQNHAPLSDSELAAITARGKFLAEYDIAAWHATDAVQALKPAEGSVRRYVARKAGAGWTVAFGKLNDTNDGFLVAYEATQGSDPRQFTVKTYDPPQKDTGFFYIAAKAIDIALQSSHLEKRPYNTYVLPLDSGQLYVYVLPAQTVAEVYPLGGDVRYLVSTDGTKIIETRQLHKSILEVKHSAPSGSKLAGGFHTHVLTDSPEDTDVFHVLRQTHPLPESVATKNGVYLIAIDGTIKRLNY
jgi:hypothetical protein